MKKWLILFWVAALILTVGGTSYLMYRISATVEHLPDLWTTISAADMAIVLTATVVYYYFDYARLFSLLSLLGVRLPLFRGIQVIVISEFASILTPTAELHIPASVYVLTRMNVPAGKATAAVSTKTMYGIMWVCLFALAMLLSGNSVPLPAIISNNLHFMLIPVMGIGVVFLVLTLFARHILAWTHRQEARTDAGRLKKKIISWIGRSAGSIAMIGTSTHPMHLFAHAANLGFILMYCFIGWWLAHSLNIRLSTLQALTIFSSSLMVDYLAPVPGSIGVCEFATAFMIDPRITPQSLVVAILLRLLCKYLVLIPGLLATINLLRHGGTELLASLTATRR